MARPRERTTRCTDLELVAELREGYQSLRLLAAVSGVAYSVLLRVVNGQAVTEAEEARVRLAWAKYSPEAMLDTAERVLGPLEAGEVPHGVDVAELRRVVQRLVMAVRGVRGVSN